MPGIPSCTELPYHSHRNFLLVGEEAVEDGHPVAEHGHLQAVLVLHDVEQLLQSDAGSLQLQAIPRRPFPLLHDTNPTKGTKPRMTRSSADDMVVQ